GPPGPPGPPGPNVLENGSVIAPSLRFSSAPTSGMFSNAFGRVALADNGRFFLHHSGDRNVGLGVSALGSNTTGSSNTAVGNNALLNNVTGDKNAAFGERTLASNTTGEVNSAFGAGALFENSEGSGNTAVGFISLVSNTTGSANTAVGASAMQLSTTGSYNTAVGIGALAGANGENNVGIGNGAGTRVETGSNNIDISHFGIAGDNGTVRIGTPGTQLRTFIAGISGVTTGGTAVPVVIDGAGQLGTVSSSRRYKEDIHDLGEVSRTLQQLRPVTFRYKQPAADGSQPLQYGLIAEEVAELDPNLVQVGADGQVETVLYHLLPVLLVNELQAQQRVIEKLKNQLVRLEEELKTGARP
ncbi:MAG: tail fiber domain-containing protein, partial [Acidobacteria bacterium]|nr:tail fiber domain-containing protein [Acidobacteriota bacterium]